MVVLNEREYLFYLSQEFIIIIIRDERQTSFQRD